VVIGLKKQIEVSIEGCVFANKGDLRHNEFWDAFIEFIEIIGWHFGGSTCQIDEEGNQIESIDN
jgi:hypothetical protein